MSQKFITIIYNTHEDNLDKYLNEWNRKLNFTLYFLYTKYMQNFGLSKFFNNNVFKDNISNLSKGEVQFFEQIKKSVTDESYQKISKTFHMIKGVYNSLYVKKHEIIQQKVKEFENLIFTYQYSNRQLFQLANEINQYLGDLPSSLDPSSQGAETEYAQKAQLLYKKWFEEQQAFELDPNKKNEIFQGGVCAGAVLSYMIQRFKADQKEESGLSINSRARYLQGVHATHHSAYRILTQKMHAKDYAVYHQNDQISALENKMAQLKTDPSSEMAQMQIIEYQKELTRLKKELIILNDESNQIILEMQKERLYPSFILNKLGVTPYSISKEGQQTSQFFINLDLEDFLTHTLDKLVQNFSKQKGDFILTLSDDFTVEEKPTSLEEQKSTELKSKGRSMSNIRSQIESKIGKDAPEEVKLRLEVLEKMEEENIQHVSSHAVYLSIGSSSYELHDPNIPNFKIESQNLDTFKLLLLTWLRFYSYTKIREIVQIKPK